MGVGAGLYMCDIVKKFTFAISSPDEFLYYLVHSLSILECINTFYILPSSDDYLVIMLLLFAVLETARYRYRYRYRRGK